MNSPGEQTSAEHNLERSDTTEMAWWQFWRTQEASDRSPVLRVPESQSSTVMRTSAAEAADGGSGRQSSAAAAASSVLSEGPPAWQLLPPPELQADRPMSLTFDHAIQRKIRLHLRVVEVVANLSNFFRVIAPVPRLDFNLLVAR